MNQDTDGTTIEVDVIIPVHNAASTIREAVLSALNQEIPFSSSICSQTPLLERFLKNYYISVTVCCYDDGSNDKSLDILRQIESSRSIRSGKKILEASTPRKTTKSIEGPIPSRLIVDSSKNGEARGAGFARNRAIELNNPSLSSEGTNYTKHKDCIKFLCLLDSDDIMHKHRIIEQVLCMMSTIDEETRNRTILGSTFTRDPPDSTWHYSNWANNLTDERLMLERYREITILQPTWFMPLSVWARVGGYIEGPPVGSSATALDYCSRFKLSGSPSLQQQSILIHPKFDTTSSLRLAEDLRFFHAHLQEGGTLRLHRRSLATTAEEPLPLVTYRHTANDQSQSFRTSRKLLLQLRALAFQRSVIRADKFWNSNENRFVIWGCGRDGKDFFKALDEDIRDRVYCFVDVDTKKLNAGYYVDTQCPHDTVSETKGNGKRQRATGRKIPVVHFSFLIPDRQEQELVRSEWISNIMTGTNMISGCIDKSRNGSRSQNFAQRKKQKISPQTKPTIELKGRGLDRDLLSRLPVVVCVAMYRTNGALESNVAKIGRTEGENLWHFS